MLEEKIYFMPGDIVTIRQALPNKPTMLVVRKETYAFKLPKDEPKEEFLKGMVCRWFTSQGELQEATFNTKDLILIK